LIIAFGKIRGEWRLGRVRVLYLIFCEQWQEGGV